MILLLYKCFKLAILLTLFSLLLTWIKCINWFIGNCSHTLIGAFEIKDEDNFVSWDFTSTQTVDWSSSSSCRTTTTTSAATSALSTSSYLIKHQHSFKPPPERQQQQQQSKMNMLPTPSPSITKQLIPDSAKKKINPGLKLVLDY